MNQTYIARSWDSLYDALESTCLTCRHIHCTLPSPPPVERSLILKSMTANGFDKVSFTDGQKIIRTEQE